MRVPLPVAVVIPWLLASMASAFDIEQLTCVPQTCSIQGAPLITPDGRSVLFRSTCDLDPGRNPPGAEQVFRLDLEGRRLEQITPGRRKRAARRSLGDVATDARAGRVVVVTTTGSGAPRLQLLDSRRPTRKLKPIGPPVSCTMEPALSADGQHLAVAADCRPGRPAPGGRSRWIYRTKLYLQDRPGGPFKRSAAPASRGCRVLLPRLSHDGQIALFASECDLERGMNPGLDFQFFRLDRTTGVVRQVNPPDCRVSISDPGPLVVIDYPALSADGESVVFTTGGCGTGLAFFEDSHVFRRRAQGELEQITFGFCVTQAHPPEGDLRGVTSIISPVAASEDGRTLAFTAFCDELPLFTDQTDHLFVYRDDREPQIIELFSQPSGLVDVDDDMTAVSMDAAGSTLALAAPGNPGGCPSPGGRQVYLVRNIHDPTPGPATCACPPAP